MDFRLLCNGLTRNADHTQVDFGENNRFGSHILRVLLPHEEAKAQFKAGRYYTLAVNEHVAPAQAASRPEPPRDSAGLRLDGPTLAEFIAAGYDPAHYPPAGYAKREPPPEVGGTGEPPTAAA